jgi:hypothetical protein
VVKRKIGHFGHNAIVQFENRDRFSVVRLPLPLARDPFQDEYKVAGCGHCQRFDACCAVGLVSVLAKELQDRLSASVVSRNTPVAVASQVASAEKSVFNVPISPFAKAS